MQKFCLAKMVFCIKTCMYG